MASTVITYRAPRTYRRCGDNLFDTRGARYVAARGDRNYGGARYVAVRNGHDNGYYKTKQARYVAVRNFDRYAAPRYVAVRRQQPVYVNSGVRYVAVRRAEPRVRYVDIREFEDDGYDDEIRYVKTRRNYDSGSRYVAVRGGNAYYAAPRTRYVAVRNNIHAGCARPVALRSCLDDVETTSVRRVVVRNDGYANRTNYVAVRDESDYKDHEDFDESDGDSDVTVSGEIDDDAEYFVQPTQRAGQVKYVDNSYVDDFDSDNVVYVGSNRMGNNCMRQVAVRNCPESFNTRTISYAPVSYYDDDIDDQAFLDGGGATYVAADDIEDAYSRPVAYHEGPSVVSRRTVSYVPTDDVDDYAFHGGSAETYGETQQPVSNVSYVSADEHEGYIDSDAAYVADENDMDTVSNVPVEDNEYMDAEPVSYVAADEVDDADTMYVAGDEYCPVDNNMDVSYVEAEPVYVPARRAKVRSVSYVPAERAKVHSVSYVPVKRYQDVETTYVAADEYCPMDNNTDVSYVEVAEPVYVDKRRTVLVEEMGSSYAALSPFAARIARTLGFNEGFEDGLDDLQDGDDFEPSDGGAQGYKREYGDKDAYRAAFRSAYLEGYQSGFNASAAAL